jgi:rhodanese-related sulfurtransferase
VITRQALCSAAGYGSLHCELEVDSGKFGFRIHAGNRAILCRAKYQSKLIEGLECVVSTISCQEFAPLSKKGGFDLIDVRTPMEFYEVHAVGSLNAPLDRLNPELIMSSRGARAREPLYIICRTGGRSAQACSAFVKAGFENVVNIEGGTLAWVAAGLPVNRGTQKMISLERQVRIVSGVLILAGTILAAMFSSWFLVIPGVVGADMTFAGMRNTSGTGTILAKMPWNKSLKVQDCSGGGCCSR